jgi:hypothetical protein
MSTTTTLGRRLAAAFACLRARFVAPFGRDTLRDLDDRTLADIGVSRSEIPSIEAEAGRRALRTRLRIVVSALG